MQKATLLGGWIVVLGFAVACGGGETTSTGTAGTTEGSTADASTSTSSATSTSTTDETTSSTTGDSGSGTSGEPTTGSTGDGTSSTGDGTGTTDAPPACGDGLVDPGEECDDGPNNSDTGSCTAACKLALCGDGLLGPGEACDDANQVDGDACTNACALPSCGDGVLQDGEQCDDGNADDTDACLATCVAASCGDGKVQADVEECDDGNANDADACTACKNATCADGLKNGAETDDDCGGPDCGKCGVGLSCGGHADCGNGLLCDKNLCSYPLSCKALKAAIPDVPSGNVTVDLDGEGAEPPLMVYCEQTYAGGGWTRLMSAKYPHFFNDANWQDLNANAPDSENYSIVGKRNLFKNGVTYTFRYAIGNAMTWKDGPILFQIAWQQGHDPFTAVTNGADYQYLIGDKPTTCGGFNGLHNKFNAPSYATDVDLNDVQNCWWMQVVPRDDWHKYGYPVGYLHGFLGGANSQDPKHETQWEVLYIRE